MHNLLLNAALICCICSATIGSIVTGISIGISDRKRTIIGILLSSVSIFLVILIAHSLGRI